MILYLTTCFHNISIFLTQNLMPENIYLPSSSERKRAILTYLLVGILFFSGKEDLSVFEWYHFKQAIGRYAATMFFLLLFLFVFWIPFIRVLPGILVLFNLIWWGFLVFLARKWVYVANPLAAPFWKRMYADLWGWILDLFDVKKRVYGDISLDSVSALDQQFKSQ